MPVLKDPRQAAVEHWTGVKVHGWIKEQLQVELSYAPVIRYLHELDFHLRVPRPWPLPLLDEPEREEQRQAFREKIKALAEDPAVELWFGDECGVDGDPRPRRRWGQPGSKPKVPHLGKHIRRNVVGAVCPQSGEFFSLIFDGVDSAVFQCWIDELAQSVPPKPGVRRLLVLDNASWCSTTPPGTRSKPCNGITSSRCFSRPTVPTSIPSNGCGCGSRRTTSPTGLRAQAKISWSVFATHSITSSTTHPQPPPSAHSGNEFCDSL